MPTSIIPHPLSPPLKTTTTLYHTTTIISIPISIPITINSRNSIRRNHNSSLVTQRPLEAFSSYSRLREMPLKPLWNIAEITSPYINSICSIILGPTLLSHIHHTFTTIPPSIITIDSIII